MTVANILIYLGLIVLIVVRRFRGHPVGTPRRLFVLPVIVTILGYGDLSSGAMTPLEITLTAIGAAISLGLGLARGGADKLTERDGAPYVQWGVASLILFLATLAAKLVIDLAGVAAGGTSVAAGKSLVFTFGLTLVGEAVVVFLRSGRAGLSGPVQPAGHRGWPAAAPQPETDMPAPRRGPDLSALAPERNRGSASLRRDYEGLRRDYDDHHRDNEGLRRDYDDHHRDNEGLRRDYEDHHRDYEDLRRDYEDLRRDYEDHHRDHRDHHRDHEDHLIGKLVKMVAEELQRRDD